MELTITILGSGTSTGVPVVGCDCAVCRSTNPRNRRMRCSALISWGGHNILIDTAPDLRQQALDNNIQHLDAVLYTHSHADHMHGIDDLRVFNTVDGNPLPVYASAAVINRLQRCFNYVFEWTGKGYRPRLCPVVLTGAVQLCGRTVEPIELVHGESPAIGYRIGDMAYLTDCSEIPLTALAKLKNLKLLVIDGLRFRHHATHFTVAQAIAVGQQLQARRIVLTHLSHDVDYVTHSAELPHNVEFAYDGLTITLT